MREAIARAWPQWSDQEEFRGVEAAEFTAEILPELEKVEDLEVEVVGTRPNYTRLEGNPHIKVTAVESDRNDWFDLGFEITIHGHQVPFPDLFAALSRGNKKLLLLDRSYLSLEHPAFDDLRELLTRAEDLPEWEPDRPTLSKYQVHVWEEFEDLADETVAARSGGGRGRSARPRGDRAVLPPAALTTQQGYQQEGSRMVAFLHRNNPAGSSPTTWDWGRPLQTLSPIAHARETSAAHPFLIIAPTSVVATWMSEAAKFLPDLRVAAVTHTRRKRKTPLAQVIAGADVVVTSYAIARLDAGEFHTAPWAGLVLDEAQFVKNPGTRLHQEISNIPATASRSPARRWRTPHRPVVAHVDQRAWAAARPGGFVNNSCARSRRNDRLLQLRRPCGLPLPARKSTWPRSFPQAGATPRGRTQRSAPKFMTPSCNANAKGSRPDRGSDKNRFIVFRSLTLLRMLALALGSSMTSTPTSNPPNSIPSSRIMSTSQLRDTGCSCPSSPRSSKWRAEACESGLSYEYLDGSTTNRARVTTLPRRRCPGLLHQPQSRRFRLTTEADYAFVLDLWWNPAAESQAVDRTHRIGQTRNVIVPARRHRHDRGERWRSSAKGGPVQRRRRRRCPLLPHVRQRYSRAV